MNYPALCHWARNLSPGPRERGRGHPGWKDSPSQGTHTARRWRHSMWVVPVLHAEPSHCSRKGHVCRIRGCKSLSKSRSFRAMFLEGVACDTTSHCLFVESLRKTTRSDFKAYLYWQVELKIWSREVCKSRNALFKWQKKKTFTVGFITENTAGS